jgi:hypothetical protein
LRLVLLLLVALLRLRFLRDFLPPVGFSGFLSSIKQGTFVPGGVGFIIVDPQFFQLTQGAFSGYASSDLPLNNDVTDFFVLGLAPKFKRALFKA